MCTETKYSYKSHTLMLLSALPVTRLIPSGLKTRERMGESVLVRQAVSYKVVKFQSRTEESRLELAKSYPSTGLKQTSEIESLWPRS